MMITTNIVGALGRPSEETKSSFCQELASACRTVTHKRGMRKLTRLLRFLRHMPTIGDVWKDSRNKKRRPARNYGGRGGDGALTRSRPSTLTQDGGEGYAVRTETEQVHQDREQVTVETSGCLRATDRIHDRSPGNLASAPRGDAPDGLQAEYGLSSSDTALAESDGKPAWDNLIKTAVEIEDCTDLSDRFELAIDLLVESRNFKESELRKFKRDVKSLDDLDWLEQYASDHLYGIFIYCLGLQEEGQPVAFDKNSCDKLMEEQFGSLDEDGCFGRDDTLEARLLFSCYLTRKVWVPLPWRKFETALSGFYERTLFKRVEAVDEGALHTARRILALLIAYGPSYRDFIDEEPNSESACLEASRREGGKRTVLYLDEDGPGDFGFVVPAAIYTGGKIRVITVGTARTSSYLWVNHWLGACLRRLDCSIFGGEVEKWWEKVKKEFQVQEGEFYISGDLENATDNFDGRITDVLIDMICDATGMTEQDALNMKSFTTRCQFAPDKASRERFEQQNGNMMGSEISFPILCIFSLTAFFCRHPERSKLFQNKRRAWKFLKQYRRFGFNGDDVVFPARCADFWLEGVAAVGGIVSRGKSLRNPYFFTVNSELWCSDGPLFCARPSTLTALNDSTKYFMSPQKEWTEYSRCGLFVRDHFRLARRLRADLPTKWGGLGLVKAFNPFSCALAKLMSAARKQAQKAARWRGAPGALEDLKLKQEEIRGLGPKVPVIMTREGRSAFQRLYFSRRAVWKDSVEVEHDPNLIAHARYQAEYCRADLLAEYNELMSIPPGQVYFELPASLVIPFNARRLDGVDPRRSFGPVSYAVPDERIWDLYKIFKYSGSREETWEQYHKFILDEAAK